jgi:hypothetical protein
MTTYEIRIADHKGRHLFILEDWDAGYDFEYVKVVNGVGKFKLDYPAGLPDASLRIDHQIQFYRKQGGVSRLDFLGFLRYHKTKRGRDGSMVTTMKGHDANGLLERRIVAYPGFEALAGSGGINVGDAMKKVVRSNYAGDATDSARDLTTLGSLTFTIAPNLADGPTIDKSFAWRRVIDVLKELNEYSYTGDDEVFFELQINSINPTTGKVTYNFRTSTGQPGRDLSVANQNNIYAVLSNRNETLIGEFYEEDSRKERNYIYVLGIGEGWKREQVERSDTARINQSIFNRVEGMVDGSSVDPDNETAELQALGDEELARKRPKIRAGGTIVSRPLSSVAPDSFILTIGIMATG